MTRSEYQKHHACILLILWSMFFLLLPGCKQQEDQPGSRETDNTPRFEGTIIAVGDSLTAGLGVALDEAWPALLQEKLSKNGYNWQVINAGISGETSSGVLSRVKWIVSRQPDIVILETGANDGLRGIPPAVIRENIDKAVRTLKENGVQVVLAGMEIVRNLGPEYTAGFAAIYPDIAEIHDVILIPFLLRNVGGVSSLNQADAIHPNAAGHRIIAATVYPFVVRAITENM